MEQIISSLHPKIVHFAVSMIVCYGIFEILFVLTKKKFLMNTAFLFLSIGLLSSLLAVLSGHQAAEMFEYWGPQSDEVVQKHILFANIVLWGSLFTSVLRIFLMVRKRLETNVRFVMLIPSIVLIYAIFITGQLGGKLVFEHGVNVSPYIELRDNEFNSGDEVSPNNKSTISGMDSTHKQMQNNSTKEKKLMNNED